MKQMPQDILKAQRDRRLRRTLLNVLKLAMSMSPTGELSGRALVQNVEAISGVGERFEDDVHAQGLLRELGLWGYISERDVRTHQSQRWGLDLLAYKLTQLGDELLQEMRPPHPGIDDERIQT